MHERTADVQPSRSGSSARQSSGGVPLGRVLGVRVRADWSLLLIFALIVLNLGRGLFPAWHPTWSPALTWGLAFIAAVLFFVSVLVHELAHAVVAKMRGIPVHQITLFLFGGLAHMEEEPDSPKTEFLIAIVGPATSLALGIGASFAGSWLLGASEAARAMDDPEAAFRALGPGGTLLLWLGPLNIMLGVFNMLPGFPLDGGRVFRSIVWKLSGDLDKATRWASVAGRGFALLLMVLGVTYFFRGAFGQGLWLVLIGWFLHNAARMSLEQLRVTRVLRQVPVSRMMRRQVDWVPPELPLENLVREHLMAGDQQAFPVEQHGDWVGLVSATEVRRVPPSKWGETRVADVMTPASAVPAVSPSAGADEAFGELAKRELEELPVAEGGHFLGMVRRSDLLRWLSLHDAGHVTA